MTKDLVKSEYADRTRYLPEDIAIVDSWAEEAVQV